MRTFPSINRASEKTNLTNLQDETTVVIKEKYDGSQFTIHVDQQDVMHYYNKKKEISGKGKVWLNSYLSLVKKQHFFKKGYWYHGEAMKSRQPNTVRYHREPKYFWVLYEIAQEDGRVLTPQEMETHTCGTGIHLAQILFDSTTIVNNGEEIVCDYIEMAKKLLLQMENSEIESSLGGMPEGLVLTVLNRERKDGKDGFRQTRYKFVRKEFSEKNSLKKRKLPTLSDQEIINGIGSIYNTDARKQKAVQHLKEREKGGWNFKNLMSNVGKMVDELDADLLKEEEEEIKDLLFIRFWPLISKAARGDIIAFLKNME